MRSKSMKKTPGGSVIEVNNVAEEFISGDHSNRYTEDIYSILEMLALHNADMVTRLNLCRWMQVTIYDNLKEISVGKCKNYFHSRLFELSFLF